MALILHITKQVELEDGTIVTEPIKATFLNQPNEITLKRWALYFELLEDQEDWFKGFHKAQTEDKKRELQELWTSQQWAQSYVIFAQLSLVFIEGASLQDLLDLPLNSEDEAVDSLMNLFILTLSNVYGYTPQPREFFMWKGRKFKAFSSKKIAGQDMPGADMTARDAANALQLEHYWQQEKGSNEYNINVGVLSALSREVVEGKAEIPPVDISGSMVWASERQELFSDITIDIALDVVFFSLHLKALSRSTLLSVLCFRPKETEVLQETPSKNLPSEKRNTKLSGSGGDGLPSLTK